MTTPAGNASGADAADYTTNYAYNPAGQLTAETGPPVSVSSYTSQTATSTRPQTTDGYNTFGDQTQAVDPDGNVTTTAYDGDGRTTSVAQAAYTPPGTSSAITATTAYAYDEDGNLVSETDPEGNVTSATYDALGDVTSVTDPQLPGQSSPGTSTYTYDADGERLSATDPLGNATRQTYDYFGNVATSTDPMDNTTKYAYDYLGDQTRRTRPTIGHHQHLRPPRRADVGDRTGPRTSPPTTTTTRGTWPTPTTPTGRSRSTGTTRPGGRPRSPTTARRRPGRLRRSCGRSRSATTSTGTRRRPPTGTATPPPRRTTRRAS